MEAKDFIKESNVICTYQHNKYLCFEVCTKKNDFGSVFTIKINPNETQIRAGEAKSGG